MSKIRVLPEILANKIAAGEVVERPASVVKELLENSLDAGARRIRVETDAGGKRFIKITDDGEGMTRDDAMLAFERHATSKLRDIDELESIKTLGFRGEALPSIASVSRVTLRTKTSSDLEGTEIEIAGGRMLHIKDLAWPGGTEMQIQDLFFNVPARRKFLKSDSTESFHITNLITHYALANPTISFVLVQNNRELINATPVETLKERAYQLFGADFIENLIEINAPGEIAIHGFVSKPQEQRASRDAQYLFVNGRFVRDRILARAITDAYKNVIPPGTHPVVMLMVEMHNEDLDVNVHPAKTEVRFRHPFAVSEAVCSAIRNAFTHTKPFASYPARNSGLTLEQTTEKPPTGWEQHSPISAPTPLNFSGNSASNVLSENQSAPPTPVIRDIDDPFERSTPDKTSSNTPNPATSKPNIRMENAGRAGQSTPAIQQSLLFNTDNASAQPTNRSQESVVEPEPVINATTNAAANFNVESRLTPPTSACAAPSSFSDAIPSATPNAGKIKPLGQLRDSYIVAVDDQGLMLIDQHVAHERVLFEIHLERILAQQLELQRLLIPETLDLTPAQLSAYELIEAELEAGGFEMMRLSGRTIAIKSSPALLSAADMRLLFLELLSVVERERRALSIEHFQREIAASVACHSAIKVNTPLTEEKMQWLIDELLKTKSPTNCPHGRPIILRFSMREIERSFKRI